ncbi:transcriptional regulator [Rhizobium ruizarguesonis]|jgi:DNA-binding HxlR family transcriptional regulator|uniref:winged helix-turn-helix transcriptional regulator n=1 Tax=Rhizobium TaxID=379 RepID=UPI0010315B15|nr:MULTISPECIES: helix-turn-helix domain-containing protein [Rhizobium]NEH75690.1 transcriptional regulator [Rhizobium ruizarguesonis]NEJ16676.1 transcriptional regulator [Rhizobium ruizarguesonis]NEJ85516.1 transcriptional regulator [Rhizobium ruizarguesonis]NEJ96936.1 transcriptional regulator [Rhizobium ruizarguesonis]NEK30504.1 transcriptional regulator [Rhizobium ruizarguesonis]
MDETITHLKVPISYEDRSVCLGPDGSVGHVTRIFRMVGGRWKLPILFRLFADPSMRTSSLLRDIPGISQKMLTQHLRELEADGLIARRDFGEQPPHVEYALTEMGRGLLPVLKSVRQFSQLYP